MDRCIPAMNDWASLLAHMDNRSEAAFLCSSFEHNLPLSAATALKKDSRYSSDMFGTIVEVKRCLLAWVLVIPQVNMRVIQVFVWPLVSPPAP
jgi:hypothetical protein